MAFFYMMLVGSPDGIAAPLFLKINVMYPPQETQKGCKEAEALCSFSLIQYNIYLPYTTFTDGKKKN